MQPASGAASGSRCSKKEAKEERPPLDGAAIREECSEIEASLTQLQADLHALHKQAKQLQARSGLPDCIQRCGIKASLTANQGVQGAGGLLRCDDGPLLSGPEKRRVGPGPAGAGRAPRGSGRGAARHRGGSEAPSLQKLQADEGALQAVKEAAKELDSKLRAALQQQQAGMGAGAADLAALMGPQAVPSSLGRAMRAYGEPQRGEAPKKGAPSVAGPHEDVVFGSGSQSLLAAAVVAGAGSASAEQLETMRSDLERITSGLEEASKAAEQAELQLRQQKAAVTPAVALGNAEFKVGAFRLVPRRCSWGGCDCRQRRGRKR